MLSLLTSEKILTDQSIGPLDRAVGHGIIRQLLMMLYVRIVSPYNFLYNIHSSLLHLRFLTTCLSKTKKAMRYMGYTCPMLALSLPLLYS